MNETAERFIIYLLFGAALALFCWRFAGKTDAGPNLVERPDVPEQSPLPAQPQAIVGMSTLPGDGEAAGPWWYTANVPTSRPAMPPIPSAVKGS